MERDCSVYQVVDIIGKKWTLLILLEIYKIQRVRYSVLKKRIPEITPKILSARLKELAKEGLIVRETDARTFPIKCEYSLSQSGHDFIDILKEIKNWSLVWKSKNKACAEQECKKCKL